MGVALSGQRRRDLEAMHGAVYKSGIFYRARGHYAFQIFPTWQPCFDFHLATPNNNDGYGSIPINTIFRGNEHPFTSYFGVH